MVDLIEQYDPDATGREDVPDGTYEAQIVESAKELISKDKDCGDCLNLCWQITSGPLEKRLFWQKLNLWWNGPEKTPGQVVKIANGQFADVRKATGVAVPNQSEDLHFIPCVVTYGRQKTDPQYGEVKSVKAIGEAPARQVAGGQPPARQGAPAAANTGASRPWGQRKTA